MRAFMVQHGVGELAVGHQRRRLEDHAGDDVGEIDLPQQVDRLAGARQLRQDQVLEDQEEPDRVEPPLDLPAYPTTPRGDHHSRLHPSHVST